MLNHSVTSFVINSFFCKFIYNSFYAVMYILVTYPEKLNGSYCVEPFLSRKFCQHTRILLLMFSFHKIQCSFVHWKCAFRNDSLDLPLEVLYSSLW